MTLVSSRFWLGGLDPEAPEDSHLGKWWLLCPGWAGRQAGRTEGKGICTSTTASLAELCRLGLWLRKPFGLMGASLTVGQPLQLAGGGPLFLEVLLLMTYWLTHQSPSFISVCAPHAYFVSSPSLLGFTEAPPGPGRQVWHERLCIAAWDPGGCHSCDRGWLESGDVKVSRPGQCVWKVTEWNSNGAALSGSTLK